MARWRLMGWPGRRIGIGNRCTRGGLLGQLGCVVGPAGGGCWTCRRWADRGRRCVMPRGGSGYDPPRGSAGEPADGQGTGGSGSGSAGLGRGWRRVAVEVRPEPISTTRSAASGRSRGSGLVRFVHTTDSEDCGRDAGRGRRRNRASDRAPRRPPIDGATASRGERSSLGCATRSTSRLT